MVGEEKTYQKQYYCKSSFSRFIEQIGLVTQTLKALPSAMSFFTVRIAYALISGFAVGPDNKWNFESGSTSLFACMALLLEYLIAGIFVYIGLRVSNSDNVYGEGDALRRYVDLDAKTH
jgi:hypothetical protein